MHLKFQESMVDAFYGAQIQPLDLDKYLFKPWKSSTESTYHRFHASPTLDRSLQAFMRDELQSKSIPNFLWSFEGLFHG